MMKEQQPLDLERLIILNNVEMPQFARRRTVRIYLPKGYAENTRFYSVLYMQDGQNVFQNETATYGTSWGLAASLDELAKNKKNCIVVAIDSGQEHNGLCRYFEYSAWQMDSDFSLPSRPNIAATSLGGEAKAYVSFILDTLKPYIDKRFRTLTDRENTFIAGSSMGGLLSLYAALSRPDCFGAAGVFSPAFWFNRDAVFDWVKAQSLAFKVKIYMDIGGKESSDHARADFPDIYLNQAREMRNLLLARENIELEYQEKMEHEHNEAAWAARFPYFANWLL